MWEGRGGRRGAGRAWRERVVFGRVPDYPARHFRVSEASVQLAKETTPPLSFAPASSPSHRPPICSPPPLPPHPLARLGPGPPSPGPALAAASLEVLGVGQAGGVAGVAGQAPDGRVQLVQRADAQAAVVQRQRQHAGRGAPPHLRHLGCGLRYIHQGKVQRSSSRILGVCPGPTKKSQGGRGRGHRRRKGSRRRWGAVVGWCGARRGQAGGGASVFGAPPPPPFGPGAPPWPRCFALPP